MHCCLCNIYFFSVGPSDASSKNTGQPLLSLSPPEEVVFNQNSQGDLMAIVQATSISSTPVALKVGAKMLGLMGVILQLILHFLPLVYY